MLHMPDGDPRADKQNVSGQETSPSANDEPLVGEQELGVYRKDEDRQLSVQKEEDYEDYDDVVDWSFPASDPPPGPVVAVKKSPPAKEMEKLADSVKEE